MAPNPRRVKGDHGHPGPLSQLNSPFLRGSLSSVSGNQFFYQWTPKVRILLNAVTLKWSPTKPNRPTPSIGAPIVLIQMELDRIVISEINNQQVVYFA